MMTQAANDMGEEQPQGVPEAQPYTARTQSSALGNDDDELMGEIESYTGWRMTQSETKSR